MHAEWTRAIAVVSDDELREASRQRFLRMIENDNFETPIGEEVNEFIGLGGGVARTLGPLASRRPLENLKENASKGPLLLQPMVFPGGGP